MTPSQPIRPLFDTSPVTDAYRRCEAMISRHAYRDLSQVDACLTGDSRAARAGRAQWKLGPETHARIRGLHQRGRKQAEIARELGLHVSTVHQLLKKT